ncbi:MAG TPA: tetratricopeptide repeat protein, partial [Burkholderiales bacterium]|nr:tetratricopeptide repeat protein [Burkholderiales bacterium]
MLPLLCLASCADPVNQRNARQYHDWGLQAERAGNYVLAERNYERALVNARLGHSPDSGLSVVMYNLGRTKGYLCKYDESEKLLLEALRLEEKASGADGALTVMRLFELARLQYDRKLYDASLPYFERAIPAVARLGAETHDP